MRAAGPGVARVCALLLGAGLLVHAPSWASPGPTTTRAEAQCARGLIAARAGQLASAESLFVAMLSGAPRDGRALTNLGNLALLRGDHSVALVFYDRAVLADTLDGGIRLDRALVLALLGHERESQFEAREGIRLAGGLTAAGALLGLRREASEEEPRAAAGSSLTQQEVRNLLKDSLKKLPVDSTRTAAQGHPRPEPPRRIAGARAEEVSEAGMHLYWKR
jgi:tetratricopeptide (TPR) repeat protein